MHNVTVDLMILYFLAGLAWSALMFYVFRPRSYRPPIWIVVLSVVMFTTLWPFIAVAAICYLIGHLHRLRSGEICLPEKRAESWAERDTHVPSVVGPRR